MASDPMYMNQKLNKSNLNITSFMGHELNGWVCVHAVWQLTSAYIAFDSVTWVASCYEFVMRLIYICVCVCVCVSHVTGPKLKKSTLNITILLRESRTQWMGLITHSYQLEYMASNPAYMRHITHMNESRHELITTRVHVVWSCVHASPTQWVSTENHTYECVSSRTHGNSSTPSSRTHDN